jgi:peptidoglycan/xylan/chitin deacetylase (PgdA/CDA1 family)
MDLHAELRRRVLHGLADVAPRSLIVRRGAKKDARVSLTFDDGPDELTPRYLDMLDQLGVRATFFVLGRACLRHPAHLRDIVARGHEVASHGHTHRVFPSLSADELAEELGRARQAIPPRARGRLVRPPRGAVSPRSLLRCAAAGYTTVLWSLDSDDCRTRSVDTVVQRVSAARPGDIVLLHEGQTWTLDALAPMVASLRAAGRELVTVGEILGRANHVE